MNTASFDLDALRQRWAALDCGIDAQLAFDPAALRDALSRRVRSAFRRHSAWLLVGLVADAVALAGLVACAVLLRESPALWLSAVAVLLLVVMETATDVDAWRRLRALDFDAPVLAVRDTLARLRARRLRTTGVIVLGSVALWLPLLCVSMAVAFGVDLYRHVHWSVFAVNIVAGLVLLPFGAWIGGGLARRFGGRPGFERMLDDSAGHHWRVARERWETLADTDALVARGDAAALVAMDAAQRQRLHAMAQPLAALRRSLWTGIVVLVPLLLGVALFNVTHGGQVRALVPGLVLHFALLVHLVANIAHLQAVRRLDVGGDVGRVIASLRWMARRREVLARVTVVVAPWLVLPLGVVVGRVVGGVDVVGVVPVGWLIGVVVACVGASVVLLRVRSERWFDVVCCGALRRSRVLANELRRLPGDERD